MPKYAATLLTGRGRRRRVVEARTADEGRARLRAPGVFVEKIAALKGVSRRVKIARKHQIHFYQQMEMLLASGVLIPDALAKLKERFPDPSTRRVLQEVHEHVVESRSNLSKGLARFPRSFPSAVISVIAAGEEAGTSALAERFGDLADRVAYEHANRREVAKACAYPALVIVMAALLYVFLLAVVFPRLTDLLNSIGGQLPPLTRAVIGISLFVRREWAPVLTAVIGLPIFLVLLRRWRRAGLFLDRCFIRLPLIGTTYRNLKVALICTVYRSLYKANKTAPEILDGCMELVGNRAFVAGLRRARQKIVAGGSSLSEALEETRLFPPVACLAIELGEQTGKLADSLERVAQHFNQEAKEGIASLIAVINPVMTLLVVGGVGTIMLSFFQAVYQVVYVAH